MGNVNYIVGYIKSGLSFQPELQQEVAKTLLALLKIRNNKNYFMQSFSILSELESKIKRTGQLEKGSLVTLHETRKAVTMVFPELTEEESERVREYLESLLPKKEDSLEQYMSDALGLNSRELYNPDNEFSEKGKTTLAMLAMMNADDFEDFEFNLEEHISDSKIAEIVSRYYIEKGYEVEQQSIESFCVKKKEDNFLIYISNYGKKIMVSVSRLPF